MKTLWNLFLTVLSIAAIGFLISALAAERVTSASLRQANVKLTGDLSAAKAEAYRESLSMDRVFQAQANGDLSVQAAEIRRLRGEGCR